MGNWSIFSAGSWKQARSEAAQSNKKASRS